MTYEEKANSDIKDMITRVNSYVDSNKIVEQAKNKSIKSRGAKAIKAKKSRKFIFKIDFKRFLVALSVIIAVVSGTVVISKKAIYHNKIDEAHDYMIPKIVSYLDESDVDYAYLPKGKDYRIIFTEVDISKLHSVYEKFIEEGFNENEAIYAIYKICGKDSVNQFVKSIGYDSFDQYLEDYYFVVSTTESGETVLSKNGSTKVFENNSENGYLRRVSELQSKEMSELLAYESQSLGGKK